MAAQAIYVCVCLLTHTHAHTNRQTETNLHERDAHGCRRTQLCRPELAHAHSVKARKSHKNKTNTAAHIDRLAVMHTHTHTHTLALHASFEYNSGVLWQRWIMYREIIS